MTSSDEFKILTSPRSDQMRTFSLQETLATNLVSEAYIDNQTNAKYSSQIANQFLYWWTQTVTPIRQNLRANLYLDFSHKSHSMKYDEYVYTRIIAYTYIDSGP